jgi:hypothetical protein
LAGVESAQSARERRRDAASRLGRLKRHLVLQLFTQSGPFWEAIRDVRARLGVEARTEVPPPSLAYAVLVAEEEWPEVAADLRERLIGEVFHLMDLTIPKEYRDYRNLKVFEVPWIGFLLGCVFFDPPETELLAAAAGGQTRYRGLRGQRGVL